MSSGAALSTPREHLTNIENALKATGHLAANARTGIAAAGRAYPLGSLLTCRANTPVTMSSSLLVDCIILVSIPCSTLLLAALDTLDDSLCW